MALFKRRSTPDGAEGPDEGVELSDVVDEVEDIDGAGSDDGRRLGAPVPRSTARRARSTSPSPTWPTRTSPGSISGHC